MVDRYVLGLLAGVVLVVAGIGAVATVNPIAAAGAAATVVGLVVTLAAVVLKMLHTLGLTVDQLF